METTGDLAADLVGLLQRVRDGLSDSSWTRVLPSLIGIAEGDEKLTELHAGFTERRREPILARLRTGVSDGELPAGADVHWLCDALVSPLFYRRYHRHVPTPVDYLVEHVRRCLAAAGGLGR